MQSIRIKVGEDYHIGGSRLYRRATVLETRVKRSYSRRHDGVRVQPLRDDGTPFSESESGPYLTQAHVVSARDVKAPWAAVASEFIEKARRAQLVQGRKDQVFDLLEARGFDGAALAAVNVNVRWDIDNECAAISSMGFHTEGLQTLLNALGMSDLPVTRTQN